MTYVKSLRCCSIGATLAIACGLMHGWAAVPSHAAEPTPEADAEAASKVSFFNESVLPILRENCFTCHSHAAGKAKGGLVLDSRGGWATGGDSGPAVVPNQPAASLLIQAVRYKDDLQMPPSGQLSAAAIATLERWVRDGAADPRIAAPANSPATDIAAGRQHWAFQPLASPSPPAVTDGSWPRDDVDRFVLAQLEAQGLHPVADADRFTWLRRVSLDLTGLPPTPEHIAAYIADESPEADARVVDRLLESRAFGERWGRHWLDLVGFADQIGTANDIFAEHAWRYRDYVMGSFNADQPFDQFIREQLAGDLLPYTSPEQQARQIVATGFLLLGDLTIVEADKLKLRVDVVDQQVDKVGRAFLAMTVGCARCHDHKFDPIPQRDYYALAGFFYSTESIQRAEWGVWSWPTVVTLPESEQQQAERHAKLTRHQQEVASLRTERERCQTRKAEVDAALTPPAGAEAKDDAARGVLVKVQQDLAARLQQLDRDIQHLEFFAPAAPRAFAVFDLAEPAHMRITIRGNAHALGDAVPRGYLQVASDGAAPSLAPQESGRRQLAEWIASPANPLTARVAVNRIWQKLFGEGLVRSVDYFGLPGARPSHPELLDHLAQRFIAEGWSRKRFIRTLVLSRAYRMSSSELNPAAAAVDPEDRWLWRMPRVRMDAEALRDSLLLVAGRLMDSPGGPSLPLEYVENTGNLFKPSVNPPFFRLSRFRPEQEFERTVYLPVVRSAPQSGPSELRNVFDFTQPAEFAGRRSVTAVPTQALFLMNSTFMRDRARDLAQRILDQDGDETARLDALWLRALGRPIREDERADAATFLAELRTENGSDKAAETELRCWAELCHAVLAGNEFLMRQ